LFGSARRWERAVIKSNVKNEPYNQFFSADGENHLFDADHSQIQKEWLESILHFFDSLNGNDGGVNTRGSPESMT
jgi:hypothetical protein